MFRDALVNTEFRLREKVVSSDEPRLMFYGMLRPFSFKVVPGPPGSQSLGLDEAHDATLVRA
jgi:hypothetical protein